MHLYSDALLQSMLPACTAMHCYRACYFMIPRTVYGLCVRKLNCGWIASMLGAKKIPSYYYYYYYDYYFYYYYDYYYC